MKLSLVTGNTGKYEQIVRYLPGFLDVEQVSLDIPEIQTNLLTEISADKCIQAFQQLWTPCLVDDSGIYFDAFNEFPWALSKFLYKGIGIEWMERLYMWEKNTKAVFQTVLSYMDDTLKEPLQFVWEIEGEISFDWLWKEKENVHLPYDLIFIPDGYDKPALFEREKRKQDNHRVRAVKKFRERISDKTSKCERTKS